MPKTKLIDVAELAGVSKSTVSQYLNGRFDYMSEKTKERVRLAISELDYVPNPIARSLKTDKTKTIGVIVRDIIGYDTSHTIRAIDDYCKKSGYKVLIYNSDFDSETEASALEALYQLRVDGVIIASSGKNTALIDKYISKGLSVVYFQLEHEGNEKNIVISDYRKAAFEATEYLIKNGHNRICFLTQDFKEVKSREERYLGYTEALKKYNLPVDSALVQYWHRETGFNTQPKQILAIDNPPTAFFTQHLAITIECLKALKLDDINIPNDVSFIGFDDIPMAEFFQVPITVVKQAPYKVGLAAAKLLLDNINNETKAPVRLTVPCTLTLRDSCKTR